MFEDRYYSDDDYDTFHREKQEWDDTDDMMGYDDWDEDDSEYDDLDLDDQHDY